MVGTGKKRGGRQKEVYKFSLNERDVALDVGNTLKLDVIPDRGSKKIKPEISWISAEEGVATVTEDGHRDSCRRRRDQGDCSRKVCRERI